MVLERRGPPFLLALSRGLPFLPLPAMAKQEPKEPGPDPGDFLPVPYHSLSPLPVCLALCWGWGAGPRLRPQLSVRDTAWAGEQSQHQGRPQEDRAGKVSREVEKLSLRAGGLPGKKGKGLEHVDRSCHKEHSEGGHLGVGGLEARPGRQGPCGQNEPQEIRVLAREGKDVAPGGRKPSLHEQTLSLGPD